MDRQSFQAYCRATVVTSINKSVNTNNNEYPFITVLRGAVAENIYFSKAAASEVSKGLAVKSIAKDLYVVEVINADGEVRTKLTFNSSYMSMEDMF